MTFWTKLLLHSSLAGLSFFSLSGQEPKTLSPTEAHNHIGEIAKVCGTVVNARISKYKVSSRGRPTFFKLEESDTSFMIVAWMPDPAKPGDPKPTYEGEHVCATGKIIKRRGVSQIIVPEAKMELTKPSDEKSNDK